MNDEELVQTIKDTVRDCILDLLVYDRKEDEDLPVNSIQDAIRNGLISVEEILDLMEEEITSSIE